jgi:bifunctional UDP-N-acetylglucosamine pyrophosphorylase/glucosamine-1-phosphate N-acetyltransferase/UDP-N-acetylglucosamine pyrophosphorylase
MSDTSPIAVVLAAGKGTRMNSDLPKVLHEAAGKTLLAWVLDALSDAGCHDQIVVIGYGGDIVRTHVGARPGVQFAVQQKQQGTGDAVRAAAPKLESFETTNAACLLGTAMTKDPSGLGRIVRGTDKQFLRITEEKDATETERLIREVNMSTYIFTSDQLLRALQGITTDNAAGEYYLTDCPKVLLDLGEKVDAIACLDPSETLSVNTPQQLHAVAEALQVIHK